MNDSRNTPYAPGTVVRKFSGKPFKSGRKTATVKGVIEHLFPSAPKDGQRVMVERQCYVFSDEEEGYFVAVVSCEAVPSEPVERVPAYYHSDPNTAGDNVWHVHT